MTGSMKTLSPSSTLLYTITKKAKKSYFAAQKSLRVLKLLRIFIDSVVFRFYVVFFRFPIDTILFRVLSDRVFFESSEIGSSSLGYAVIDSSLHQCSFSSMSLFFYQIVLLMFLSNIDVLFSIHYNSQKQLV